MSAANQVDARTLHPTHLTEAPISTGSRDIYYRKAKEYGFRARSAFKLLQCDDSCNIFNASGRGVTRAVDLCAAPGSWSQVLVRKLYGNTNAPTTNASTSRPSMVPTDPALARIISVDLQEMAPLDGVYCIQGDITSRATADSIITHFGGEPVDLVVSDGAPDVTGLHEIDEYMQSQLILAALNITTHILQTGTGCFVAKIFKSDAFHLLASQLKIFFASVDCVKPSSSRIRSAEHFIVCKGFRKPPGYKAVFVDAITQTNPTSTDNKTDGDSASNTGINRLIMPYLHCGDLQPHDTPTIAESPSQASESTQSDSFTRFLGPIANQYV